MLQLKAKLNFNKKVKGNYFHLAIQAPRITKQALPGQFLNIRVNDSCEPLLRRPFSIHRVSGSSLEILYEVVGKGTEILSQRKPGDYLDVVGPLGSGFNLIPNTYNQTPILVAGGMGVAPLVFLVEKLKESKPFLLIGAKTKSQILCEKEFKQLGCSVKIATDDGSRGFKGKVTELLEKILVAGRRSQVAGRKIKKLVACDLRPETIIYACGPRPMLKEISRISQEYRIPAQISLEEHMACGIGACLGCVVKTRQGFQRVCKEGPVFKADEIVWKDTRP